MAWNDDGHRVNVILGKVGSGKSRLLTRLLAPHDRLIIVDTMLEHAGIATSYAVEDLRDAVLSGIPFRASVYPNDLEDLAWIENLAACRAKMALAIDEYIFWYPTHANLPSNGLLAMVRCGRKLHQSVFLTTQSPGGISKQMVGQAAIWVLPMAEPNDCKYVLERTAGLINPADLQVLERDSENRIINTQVALYLDGERTDYVLHTPTPEISQESP